MCDHLCYLWPKCGQMCRATTKILERVTEVKYSKLWHFMTVTSVANCHTLSGTVQNLFLFLFGMRIRTTIRSTHETQEVTNSMLDAYVIYLYACRLGASSESSDGSASLNMAMASAPKIVTSLPAPVVSFKTYFCSRLPVQTNLCRNQFA